MDEKFIDFCKRANEAWGEESQLRLCIEEMSELTKAICKYLRLTRSDDVDESALADAKKSIIEETADVTNTVEQMALIFGVDEVNKTRREKIERADEQLNDWIKNHRN